MDLLLKLHVSENWFHQRLIEKLTNQNDQKEISAVDIIPCCGLSPASGAYPAAR